MTGFGSDSASSSGLPRLEVRWIRSGALDVRMLEWFRRFPTAAESREDDYLINPDLDGLSVKIRGAGALEVKMYRGRVGVLDVPGRARGLMESWQKWSFPLRSPSQDRGVTPSWTAVHKNRRMTFFSFVDGGPSAGVPGPQPERGCAVELTEIRMHGQHWWTLGLEAMGDPPDGLTGVVQATAARVFDGAMPDNLALASEDSRSYSSWLREQLSGEHPATVSDYQARMPPAQ